MIRRVRIRRRADCGRVAGIEPSVLARLLAARGLKAPPDYSLNALLPPRMAGLDQATELLADAIVSGRRILVVGDFDADGATGTALAVRGLRALGAGRVDWRVPDRARHGYGLAPELARECVAAGVDVLVTVDQGISAHEGVRIAREAGVEVIVTDHHLPGTTLPEASAIVNPNLPNCPFPSPHLAGVGVMFYLLIALRARLRGADHPADTRLDAFLDLVAVGTVADLVSLDENNRCLVHQGLNRIAAGRCAPGIAALLEVAGRNLAHVGAADLGFAVAPRLNAAGRLEDMSIGVRCLLEDDFGRAMDLARRLDAINRDRRAIQAEMTATAEEQVRELSKRDGAADAGLCVYDASWHPGVVGLVASRLCERLRRPAIAFAPAGSDANGELKGSARSPAGVHMRDLLVALDTAHPGLIDRFGGHAGAAGLSLHRDRLDAFEGAFRELSGRFDYSDDAEISDGPLEPGELSMETAQALERAGPWGQGWPEPLFDGPFRVLGQRVVGEDHLKLQLEPAGGGPVIDAIAFRAGNLIRDGLPDPLHVTYQLEVNRFRGREVAQIQVRHLVAEVVTD